jgi:hypothetical protein
MKPVARKSDATEKPVDEVAGLERALDKSYTRMRERAKAAWARHDAGKDPSDACVSVRVTPAAESSGSASPRKSPPRLLVTKLRQPRKTARRPARRAKT